MDTNNQINLHTEIQYLKGVGPKRGKILKNFGINTIRDLIRNFPRKYLDRTNIKPINKIKINEKVVIIGIIESFGVKRLRKGKYFQLNISDDTGTIQCVWFHGISWIIEKFKKGDVIFWKGHVAICINAKKLIHAYGPEKKVLIMPIKKTITLV